MLETAMIAYNFIDYNNDSLYYFHNFNVFWELNSFCFLETEFHFTFSVLILFANPREFSVKQSLHIF